MTRFVTNYCIYNYLLSYSLFAHANTTFELNTLQIYAKYLYVSAKRGVNTQFDCANVCIKATKKMGGSHSLRTAHNI